MPLTAKGKKLKEKFKKQYGKKKGESVFYAMENSGKLKKVVKRRGGGADMGGEAASGSSGSAGGGGGRDAGMGMGGKSRSGSTSSAGRGRDPSKQYTTQRTISQKSRTALQTQRKQARARISPSTTPAGIAARAIGTLAFGIPQSLTARAIDYSPLAFGVPKSTKPKGTTTDEDNKNDRGGGLQKTIAPVVPTVIEATKPVDPNLVSPKENFFNFVAYKVGGLSGGVSYGPPPKKGPNSQVPPVKMKKGGYKK